MSTRSSLPFLDPAKQLKGVSTLPPIDFGSIESWGRVVSAYESPAQASLAERLLLFSFVLARQPARVLELGFRFGGTSFVMMCALEDAEGGRLVSIDPDPEPALDFSRFGDRFQLLRGRSPEAVPAAVSALGGPIDFCFVDASHEYRAVRADLDGILPHMADDSYVLLHDAVSPGVARAVEEFTHRNASTVVDCGLVVPHTNEQGWAGMRLLRIRVSNPAPQTASQRLWRRLGRGIGR